MGHLKRIVMLGYVVGFAMVENSTPLFAQYPPLFWVGVVGVLAVFGETARCAHHHWRELRRQAEADTTSG